MSKLTYYRCVWPYLGFTVGKRYIATDGVLRDDQGVHRAMIDLRNHFAFRPDYFQMYLEQANQL